jgi:hypothetical protein
MDAIFTGHKIVNPGEERNNGTECWRFSLVPKKIKALE